MGACKRRDVGIAPYEENRECLQAAGCTRKGGRLRALPVADAASKKEWQRSKVEAAVSAAHKFWVPQQGTLAGRSKIER